MWEQTVKSERSGQDRLGLCNGDRGLKLIPLAFRHLADIWVWKVPRQIWKISRGRHVQRGIKIESGLNYPLSGALQKKHEWLI